MVKNGKLKWQGQPVWDNFTFTQLPDAGGPRDYLWWVNLRNLSTLFTARATLLPRLVSCFWACSGAWFDCLYVPYHRAQLVFRQCYRAATVDKLLHRRLPYSGTVCSCRVCIFAYQNQFISHWDMTMTLLGIFSPQGNFFEFAPAYRIFLLLFQLRVLRRYVQQSISKKCLLAMYLTCLTVESIVCNLQDDRIITSFHGQNCIWHAELDRDDGIVTGLTVTEGSWHC